MSRETAAVEPFRFRMRPRKGSFLRVSRGEMADLEMFEALDAAYRSLCATLYSFTSSGHPGGSISSGKTVAALLFDVMDYDMADPWAPHADAVVYAAGHKAMGLYAMWALRDELARIADPSILPKEDKKRLRLEDLLGFRRNPTQNTPLFKQFRSKALDGHPAPSTPFVPFATGASGVGFGGAVGFAVAAADAYGPDGPMIHVIEGEGGMTPGRVAEAMATAVTAGLQRLIVHVDWNQASIDSDRVCPEGEKPGDYVQWNPLELLRVHDFNVLFVSNGHDVAHTHAGVRAALKHRDGVPTAVVYKTVKGWRYGVEGKKSHGAGHGMCSPAFYDAVKPFEEHFAPLPRLTPGKDPVAVEKAYWDTLLAFRAGLEAKPALARWAAGRLRRAAGRLKAADRRPRANGPRLDLLTDAALDPAAPPEPVRYEAGKPVSTRAALGETLGHLNKVTKGAFIGAAADLAESTSLATLAKGFPPGHYHMGLNPEARILNIGGICEDGMGCVMAGLSSLGTHIGVSSSYSAFIAALEHIPARLHCIGQHAYAHHVEMRPYRTWVMVNAHAGSMTGEDGPTHADPQSLQLLQENFAAGTAVTLTPWDPRELWPLMAAGLRAHPAVLAPFVTRPAVALVDRPALRIPGPEAAVKGVYALRRTGAKAVVVLQGCASGTVFARDVLPLLDKEGVTVDAYYVASAELFDLLPKAERDAILPEEVTRRTMMVSDFTVPTFRRWVRTDAGLEASLYPLKSHGYLGSGAWEAVVREGGLHGESQFEAVRAWVKAVG
jgi:transketolase